MLQAAIFVDAGYFFAQGAQLLTGARQQRSNCTLEIPALTELLRRAAANLAPDARLLRAYWYDGLIRGGALTPEQTELGRHADMKLRLGMVNSRGEQKGVDSLIVTDLVDLARNKAISDAILISGDEDIRIGVQLAQVQGVRVHLIGIKPALGSQSPDLVAEADTHCEWAEDRLREVLKVAAAGTRKSAVPATTPSQSMAVAAGARGDGSFDCVATAWVGQILDGLGDDKRTSLRGYMDANRGALPQDLDRPALAGLRDTVGRDLTDDERKHFRALLRQAVRRA